ncbi:TetR/AcrR family transcriptional regulator [Mycobacterium sp. TY815]|uniref:TetR/AcrR family transcriptional regulator n=1 Tax=Mycobacterium sp. TY815 TaxID=3050581 RepID=UPI0026D0794D|nr:TetR/AcrR family transcriptional regulator [Mycobacterium sp. TY815]MDP7703994.1 TetR/AcrR family transcriptional regulator [Mycobacterium sp. TY815]
MSGQAHLRRSPTQQRSRARVERILDAAAAIVVEQGPDSLKVSDIATRAGVPLGTLYQFFARKDDIVYALAQRFADRFGDVLETTLADAGVEADWRVLLDRLLDAYAGFYRSEPALRELWVGARLNPDFIRADHEHNNTRFAATLADLLGPRAHVPHDELALMIYVSWEASQALLETAFRVDPTGDPAIIEQAKVMAARYLSPAFEER